MMGFRYNGNTQINLWEDGRTSQGNLHVSASLGLVIQCNANDTLSFVAHMVMLNQMPYRTCLGKHLFSWINKKKITYEQCQLYTYNQRYG